MSGTFGETADDLLRNADIAMYAAKASSRGRAQVFQSVLRADAVARSELASLLRGVEAARRAAPRLPADRRAGRRCRRRARGAGPLAAARTARC